MVRFLSIPTAAIAASLLVGSTKGYSPLAKNNVALYWGQHNTESVDFYCRQEGVDVVLLSFMNNFPGQAEGGLPGTNFAGNCNNGFFEGTRVHKACDHITSGIKTCQALGKKVILALGGESGYELSGIADGRQFADWLWGAYGPPSANKGEIRPIGDSEVDGFDFDIEHPSADNQAGYIAMIHRLREHYATQGKEYLITGAPQCVVPDRNMGEMMTKAQFDMIFVQFYNTPECSARTFVDSGKGFTYDVLSASLAGTPSSNAKIYLGLPSSEKGAGSQAFYLSETEVEKLVQANSQKNNLGGIMLWDAHFAHENTQHGGRPYYQVVKDVLNKFVSSSGNAAQVRKTAAKAAPVFSAIASASNAQAVPTEAPIQAIPEGSTSLNEEDTEEIFAAPSKAPVQAIPEDSTPVVEEYPADFVAYPAEKSSLSSPDEIMPTPIQDIPELFVTYPEEPSTPTMLAVTRVDGDVDSVTESERAFPVSSSPGVVYLVPQLNVSWPKISDIPSPLSQDTPLTNSPQTATPFANSGMSSKVPAVAAVALGMVTLSFFHYA